jgi:FKBP-type peptidyl-prolyl cis-trans isomerase FklB
MLDPMVVAKAMRDGKDGKPLMVDMDARNFIMSFINAREVLRAEQKAILDKELYKDWVAQNEDFLAKNKEKPGVTTTPSGLQYEVIKMGNGPKPTTESTVKVHYVGTLIDGTEFDSSVKRNEPAEFPIIGVIPGWTEALQLMPVGSKFKLYIPQNLAYGATGAGETIKPFSTLIFEVELLEIVNTPK